MGIFAKLKFWKKEDELDFDQFAKKEMAVRDNLGMEEKSPFFEEPAKEGSPFSFSPGAAPVSPYKGMAPEASDREWELINSKLDTLKAMLSSLEQRMASLEKSRGTEQKPRLW